MRSRQVRRMLILKFWGVSMVPCMVRWLDVAACADGTLQLLLEWS